MPEIARFLFKNAYASAVPSVSDRQANESPTLSFGISAKSLNSTSQSSVQKNRSAPARIKAVSRALRRPATDIVPASPCPNAFSASSAHRKPHRRFSSQPPYATNYRDIFSKTQKKRMVFFMDIGSYTFTVTVKAHIALTYDTDTISVDYGSSADLTVDYEYQVLDTVVFSPDISADVKPDTFSQR